MSDDEDKRGQKDNTDREHKPEHAQDRENAPRGHLGTGPSLGLGGTSSPRDTTQTIEPSERMRREPEIDDRPVAPKTGDEEIDRMSEEQGHRLIPEDEFNERIKGEQGAVPNAPNPERPAETIGSASKPRDQEQVLKEAQDQQRETPDQELSPDHARLKRLMTRVWPNGISARFMTVTTSAMTTSGHRKLRLQKSAKPAPMRHRQRRTKL